MDASLTLAFSIQKNPGVYALLLGSGISRSVGIPTGWEVTQDILRQIKELGGEELSENIRYDDLLDALGKTQAERNIIIRGYFEPKPEEQEQGTKIPSDAHRAIANLVKDGYIKVILTTNFDRLLEIALKDVAITPDVIRSDDMLNGTPPIRHTAITIVQLHGDYRDIRTLNTAKELETYTPEKEAFLDIILAEYGLIVCGWSAKWDKALRDAIFRIKPRWYSSYWIEPNELSDEAKEVIHHRRAELIVSSADDFFINLQDKVEALAKLNHQHPLTVDVAVERVKKLLPLDTMQIQLEDLLRDEAEHAYQQFSILDPGYLRATPQEVDQFYISTIADYFALSEVSLNMVATLCWNGKTQQAHMLTTIASRWATAKDYQHEDNRFGLVPSLLLMYVGGMAAVHQSNWVYLRALITDPKLIRWANGERWPILEQVRKNRIFDYNIYNSMWDDNDPLTKRLKQALRSIFKRYLPIDRDYYDLFDLFEMLLAIFLANSQYHSWIGHDPVMRDYAGYKLWNHIIDFWTIGAKQGANWGFLQTFFDGDTMQLKSALDTYHDAAMNAQKWNPRHDIPDYAAVYKESFRE